MPLPAVPTVWSPMVELGRMSVSPSWKRSDSSSSSSSEPFKDRARRLTASDDEPFDGRKTDDALVPSGAFRGVRSMP